MSSIDPPTSVVSASDAPTAAREVRRFFGQLEGMRAVAAIGVLMAFARREPGAQEAFAARPSVIRRSIAVVSRSRRG